MTVYLIDGDNAPGTRTKGLGALSAEDIVCICYAKTNKYYQNHDMVKQLRNMTVATVQFYYTESNKQAVDFFLAIKAESYIQEGAKEVYLVSGDNHVATIATILQKFHPNIEIGSARTIQAGYLNDLSRIKNLDTVKRVLIDLLGDKQGEQLYDRLKDLFVAELAVHPKVSFLQRVRAPISKGRARKAFRALREQAANLPEMTLEEIDAEITAVRKARKGK